MPTPARVSISHTALRGGQGVTVRYEWPDVRIELAPRADALLTLWHRLRPDDQDSPAKEIEERWQELLAAEAAVVRAPEEQGATGQPLLERLQRLSADTFCSAVQHAIASGSEQLRQKLLDLGIEEFPEADQFDADTLRDPAAEAPAGPRAGDAEVPVPSCSSSSSSSIRLPRSRQIDDDDDEDDDEHEADVHPFDVPFSIQAEGGRTFRVVGWRATGASLSGTHCQVTRRGLGVRSAEAFATLVPCEAVVLRGQPATELDRRIGHVVDQLPALTAPVYEALMRGAGAAGKLVRILAILRAAHQDPRFRVTAVAECDRLLRGLAEDRGWRVLYGDAGLLSALDSGYDDYEAVLAAPDASIAAEPEVRLMEGEQAVFVLTADGVAVWPSPIRIQATTCLADFVGRHAPDLEKPVVRALVRHVFAQGSEARGRARDGLKQILLALRDRLWPLADPARETPALPASRAVFREACDRWVHYQCHEIYDSGQAAHWEAEAVDAFAREGAAQEQVLAPALVPQGVGDEPFAGRVRVWRRRPEWLSPLQHLSGDWPWGSVDADDPLRDLRNTAEPFRSHFAEILRVPPMLAAARAALDAIVGCVDSRLEGGELGEDEAASVRTFRDALLGWGNASVSGELGDPGEFLKQHGDQSDPFAAVPAPGDAPPTASRYVRFAPPKAEVVYGTEWLRQHCAAVADLREEPGGASAAPLVSAFVQQEVMPLPQSTVSVVAHALARLAPDAVDHLAPVFGFHPCTPWERKLVAGWTWFALDPDTLGLHDLADGEPASRDAVGELGITWASEAAPCLAPRVAYAREAGGAPCIVRGTLESIRLFLPRRVGSQGDLLAGLLDAESSLQAYEGNEGCQPFVEQLLGVCKALRSRVCDAASAVALGDMTIGTYAPSLFEQYRATTEGVCPPDALRPFVHSIRDQVARYLGATVIAHPSPAQSSADVLSWKARVVLSRKPPGEAVRTTHPFGGLSLDVSGGAVYDDGAEYAVGRGLLLAIDRVHGDAPAAGEQAGAALAALAEGAPEAAAALLSHLAAAGCAEELLANAERDLGFAPVLSERPSGELRSIPGDAAIVWQYADQGIRRVVAFDRGLRYGVRVFRHPEVQLSRGPEPAELCRLASDPAAWPEQVAPWAKRLAETLGDAAAPTAGPESRDRIAELVLRTLDSLWPACREGNEPDAQTVELLTEAARRDGVLEADTGGQPRARRDLASVSEDVVLWREPKLVAPAEAPGLRKVQFAVKAPPALSRPERYEPLLPDDGLGHAVAGLLAKGRSPLALFALVEAQDEARDGMLERLVADGTTDLSPGELARLAGALGWALEPAVAIGHTPPTEVSEEEHDRLQRAGDTSTRYLIDEPQRDVFRIAEVARYGLRRADKWLLRPSLVLETSALPEWACIARACEALLAKGQSRRRYRQDWASLLGCAPAAAAEALAKALELASRAYRAELLLGQGEEGNTVYQRLLSAEEYTRRYAAFTAALEDLGVAAEKRLYRSQLVRRVVHLDPAAPSGETPVLWSVEPQPSGSGVVLRYASAVRSR